MASHWDTTASEYRRNRRYPSPPCPAAGATACAILQARCWLSRCPGPDRVVYGVASDLFPAIITAGELIRLMVRTREPKKTVEGFEWASSADCHNPLRSGRIRPSPCGTELADLIWGGRTPTHPALSDSKRVGHPRSCARDVVPSAVDRNAEKPDADLIRASVNRLAIRRQKDRRTRAGSQAQGAVHPEYRATK